MEQTLNLLALRNQKREAWDEHVQHCMGLVAQVAKRLAPTSQGLSEPHFGFWTMQPDGTPAVAHNSLTFEPTVTEGGRVTVGISPVFDPGQHDPYYVVPLVFEFHPGDPPSRVPSHVSLMVAGESAGEYRREEGADYDTAISYISKGWKARLDARYRLGSEPCRAVVIPSNRR